MFLKSQEKANFDILRLHHLKFQIPTAWGLIMTSAIILYNEMKNIFILILL